MKVMQGEPPVKEKGRLAEALRVLEDEVKGLEAEIKAIRQELSERMEVGEEVVIEGKTLAKVEAVTYVFSDFRRLVGKLGKSAFLKVVQSVSIPRLRDMMGQEWIERERDSVKVSSYVKWVTLTCSLK